MSLSAAAQSIKWASKVEFEYNAYESGGLDYTGSMVLGPPDAFPYGQMSARAFRLKTDKAYGRLVVSFDEPQEASQIWIVENFLPGRITKVILFDTNNDKYSAYEGKPQELQEPWRNFVIDLGKRTSYKIQKIEINLISIQAPGFAQIDAIGISDIGGSQIATELKQLNERAADPSSVAPPIVSFANATNEDVQSRIRELEEAKLKQQQEEEARRKAEEERAKIEEERKKQEELERRREEEERKRQDLLRQQEELKRQEEIKRQEEALKKELEEREKVQKEEERKRIEAEQKRLNEERQRIEAERIAREEAQRKEEERLRKLREEEQAKQAAEQKQREEQEKARQEAERAARLEREKMEAELRQLREIQRIEEQKREVVSRAALPPLPPELEAFGNRAEQDMSNLTPAKIELITSRRQLDLLAVQKSKFENRSFIETTQISEQSLKPEIPEKFMRKSVGDGINTPYAEVKPIVTADGQTLYFSRQNYPENIKGEDDDQDIYVANLIDGEWSMAVNLGPPLNNPAPNGVVAVSGDGNTLLLINEYGPRIRQGSGVSISHRNAKGWSMPEMLNIENHYNRSSYVDYFLSNDGKVLILAVDRRDSKGDQDLYVSFSKGGNNWSEPRSMGAVINSKEADFSPFLAADNKTLYFASYGHGSLGGPDIFMSKRLDKSWTNWSKPVNLGATINSAGFEAYFTIPASGDYAYLVTDQGGIENSRDIYIVAIPPEFMPEPVLTVLGRVLDANTLQPLQANLVVESILDGYESAKTVTDNSTGEYQFILPGNDQYQIRTIVPGYIPANDIVDLTSFGTSLTVEKTFYMKPLGQNLIGNTQFGGVNSNMGSGRRDSPALINNQKPDSLQADVKLKLNVSVKTNDGKPLNASILFVVETDSSETFVLNLPESGVATFELPHGLNYLYTSSASGYLVRQGSIKYTESGEEEIINLVLVHEPIKKGITQTLPNILFQQGEVILLPIAYPELDSIAQFMILHPSVRIKLEGHTDAIGDANLNLDLSIKRVEVVRDYLVNKGIFGSRIEIQGYGGAKPIASNASEQTRRLNRRVDWTIIDD